VRVSREMVAISVWPCEPGREKMEATFSHRGNKTSLKAVEAHLLGTLMYCGIEMIAGLLTPQPPLYAIFGEVVYSQTRRILTGFSLSISCND
jgi:hypothetical protein